MIRGKEAMKYLKRCGLKKKIRGNNTRKTSNVSFQTLWFEKIELSYQSTTRLKYIDKFDQLLITPQ
jgi:hypothetical protein